RVYELLYGRIKPFLGQIGDFLTKKRKKKQKQGKTETGSKILLTRPLSVPHNEIFSNRFLEDLEKIWELRYYIPDPNKLEYANCDCAPCSRYKE
ncbi:MAG: hypothetical protein IKZ37_03800, partial [Bacteroidaceae bacterium]|nr:hypothetical protein [Bacteroidaceae bacterium]